MDTKQKLEQLAQERQNYIDQAQALLDEGDSSQFSEELEAQFDDLHAKAEDIDTQIKELLESEQRSAARAQKLAEFDDHSQQIANVRGVNLPSAPDAGAPRMTIPAVARRHAGSLSHFVGEENGFTAEERAFRFGQWALNRAQHDIPRLAGAFPQAARFVREHLGVDQPALVHGEGGSDTTGAHVFVPDEFGLDLVRLREMYGVARRVMKRVGMTSDTRTDPRRTGGLTAYFVGESEAGTESDASYDNIRLTAKKLMVLTRMSNELSEDAAISFGDELAFEIAYAFANKEDECGFNGDGTSTYGGISGVRDALDALTAGTAPGLILGAGNAWSELTLANHESVVGSLPQYADTPNAAWICHKTYYHTVMGALSLAAGGTTATEIRNGVRVPLFLGYPVIFSQVYPSSEANSQIPVTFGDHSMGARFGDRVGESIEFSDQVSVGGQSVWERDQVAIKGRERFDINVHDVGSNTVAGPICGLETAAS